MSKYDWRWGKKDRRRKKNKKDKDKGASEDKGVYSLWKMYILHTVIYSSIIISNILTDDL